MTLSLYVKILVCIEIELSIPYHVPILRIMKVASISSAALTIKPRTFQVRRPGIYRLFLVSALGKSWVWQKKNVEGTYRSNFNYPKGAVHRNWLNFVIPPAPQRTENMN